MNVERRAELLELLLAGGAEVDVDALERARRDPDDGVELAELESFLARARASLKSTGESREEPGRGWSPVREGALVGRVLARTTREDLSWRGELRLVAGFVRERLSTSPILRVVAASLALHVAAVPVVGWYVARERDDRVLHTGIERPLEEAFVDHPAESVQPRFPDEATAADLDADARPSIENARRRARFVLSTAVGPAPGPALEASEPASLERNLLLARSRFLAERAWTTWLDDEKEWRRAGPLARILWAELILDRTVLEDRWAPLTGEVLNALALALEGPDEPLPAPALEALGRTTLFRARAYGAWEAPGDLDPEAAPLPLGSDWFALLERAAAGTALADSPELRLFHDWIRR